MENGFFTVDYESMACVVTALVAYNIFSPFSQKIDDLNFTFVTPLRSGCGDWSLMKNVYVKPPPGGFVVYGA